MNSFFIILFSIIIQLIAGIFALLYTKKHSSKTWIFLGIALLLLSIKQSLGLFGIPINPVYFEVVSLGIAVVLFIGILSAPGIFKEIDKLISQLKGLWEIDRTIINGINPKSIIGAIEHTIVETLECNALAIYSIDKSGTNFGIYGNYNLNDEVHQQIIGDRELFKRIIKERKVNILNTMTSEKRNLVEILQKYNFSSCVGVPLILRGAPYGAMFVFFKNKRTYENKDIQYIEAITRQLVIAIERIEAIERIREMSVESVQALVQAIEMRDLCTMGHSLQVAALAIEIAQAMNFSERSIQLIHFAGLLHDVGKIAIPETILKKPGPLSEEEWMIVRRHPIHSSDIISPIRDLNEIKIWILHHHERWDGRGYPSGIKEKEIPLVSRILAVCDTYSAMVSDRPYRKALRDREAREEIEKFKGKQFDPEVVDIFLKLPQEFLQEVIKKPGSIS